MSSLLHCAPLAGQTLSANTPKAIRRLKSFRYECSSTSVRKAYSGQAGLASDSFPFGPSRHQIEMIEKSLSTDLHRQHVSHSVRHTLTTFQGVALLSPPRTRIPWIWNCTSCVILPRFFLVTLSWPIMQSNPCFVRIYCIDNTLIQRLVSTLIRIHLENNNTSPSSDTSA